MVRRVLGAFAALMLATCGSGVQALADATGPYGTLVHNAGIAIENAMRTPAKNGSVAQVPPVTQQPVGGTRAVGLPTGWTYTLDFSVAHSLGDVGRLRQEVAGRRDRRRGGIWIRCDDAHRRELL